MAKMVLDLQQACSNEEIPCSNLLLKAYAIAKKLGMQEIAEFLDHEINGYRNVDKKLFPEFRQVIVSTEAYDAYYGRWIPVVFPANSAFSKHSVVESIAEIEKIDQSKCDSLEVRLNADAQKIIQKATNMSEPMLVHQIFPASQITSIPSKLRKYIFDWAYKLETEGILGENLEFTTEEQKIAKENPSVQIIINGNVFGSNVSGILNDSISKVQSQRK